MASFAIKDDRPYRLRVGQAGVHRFGGPPTHRGIVPAGTKTPLHLLLTLDLRDPHCPVKSERPLRYLPLYYPLKYGYGGPTVQYDVRSESDIELLFLSDPQPDPADEQYVRVDEFPSSSAEIVPLTYEEARIVAFRKACGHFQPSAADAALLERLNRDHLKIEVGGGWRLPVNAGDVICHNPACAFFDRRVHFDLITSIPPVPVNGRDDFWHEYQGGYMWFYFGLCYSCGTVIAFNVAT